MYHIHKAKSKAFKVNIPKPIKPTRVVVTVLVEDTAKAKRRRSRGGGGICTKTASASYKKLMNESKPRRYW